MFADLVGSTSLHERLDAEAVGQFMEDYYAAMRAAVEMYGGRVTQQMGDGVKALFGAPRIAEDDAIRAVRAAVEMQRTFRALGERQRERVGKTGLRVAVNTGEVVAEEGQEIIGDPVNVAARLQEQGRDGDVVMGGSTQRVVASLVTLDRLGSFALKGRSEEVEAYRVVSLDAPAEKTAAPFVGRAEELARLDAVYDDAIAKPAARLAVLLGSPGLGKSRLIDEFLRRRGDAVSVLTAHCDAASGATFAPLAEAIREYFDVDDSAGVEALRSPIEAALDGQTDRMRIVDGITALLAGVPSPPEETFFVIRRLITGLAGARPVSLVIDDLQWAEPLLLDLVEHLVQWGGGVRLLILVGARPELRDLRSSLVAPGGLVSEVLTLHGLDAGAATRLAANVIGAADLPATVAAKVLATSEGNPLFVGELVRMLVREGALTKEGERWTTGASLDALEMPPTIHALLAARIERLRSEECRVLECAAVVGRHFSRGTVAALLPGEVAELDQRLEALRRSELIEPDAGWLLGEPVLRFHHVLIRDAAYRRLLKGTRAELHGRLADWIEARVGDTPEHDETIGWHLEHAHQLLRELGPVDANGKSLGERAAQRLAAAGRRALARDDVPVAADLLGRAIDRLEPEDPSRADLALDWCESLLAAGDVAHATNAIDELARFLSEDSPATANNPTGNCPSSPSRLRAWHTCFSSQLTVLTAPQELQAAADAVASAAKELAKLGDEAGEAKAHSVHALALARLGRVGACEAALDKALAAARTAGDRRRANAVLAGAPLAALWGPSPVTRASGRCLDVVRVLRITQGAPAVEAVALSCQGVLEALRGRTDAARRMIASSRTMVEELGIAQRLFEADVFAGRIDLLEGNAAVAERTLRGAYDGLRELGLGIDAARAGALLGRALLERSEVAEAERLSHESEELAGDDLQAAIAWRGVRAGALARRGEHAAAVELAQAAVDIAAATDALLDHADARLALAAALRAAGHSDEAQAEELRAVALWEAKGATLLAERALRHEASGGRRAPRRAVKKAEEAPPPSAPEPSVVPAPRRRVRPNAATAANARIDAATAARDLDARRGAFSEDYEEIHHPTGATCDLNQHMAYMERLFRSPGAISEYTPLATLGASLALGRRLVGASANRGGRFDVGEYENEVLTVTEVNRHGLGRRQEIFGLNQLSAALTQLYERYAESLPEGAERERARATAASIAGLVSASDSSNPSSVLGSAVEVVDHRVVGFGTLRGAKAVDAWNSLLALAVDLEGQFLDVLAAIPDAMVVKARMSGRLRDGGGAFERTGCLVLVFGADGRITHYELFEDDRDAEALAHFDELVGTPDALAVPRPPLPRGDNRGVEPSPSDAAQGQPSPLIGKEGRPARARTATQRRVPANSASAVHARIGPLLRARDFDGLLAMFSESYEEIHHPTGSTYGRAETVASMQRLFRSQDATYESEPLATLGSSLILNRTRVGARATGGGRFDVGAYETEMITVMQLDECGLFAHEEVFAADHLADALTRLYERYAELLPPGPQRERAHATAAASASSLAALAPSFDCERFAAAVAPDIECVDNRLVRAEPIYGAEAFRRALLSLQELAQDMAYGIEDILALQPEAVLGRWRNSGTDRAGGGPFERPFLSLGCYSSDGRLARIEFFDVGHETEALARFDELTAESAPSSARRRVRPNAASAMGARLEEAVAARDFGAVRHLFGETYREVSHPTGATYGTEGAVRSLELLCRSPDARYALEPLATLGPSLVLARRLIRASAARSTRYDVGEYENDAVGIIETDKRGLIGGGEIFVPEQLGDAIARLYERYAGQLPAGSERGRAAAIARAVVGMMRPLETERFAATLAPGYEAVDHRLLGTWSARDPQAMVAHLRSMVELASDVAFRVDDVLALEPRTLLWRTVHSGTAREGGGTYERPYLMLTVFSTDGLVTRVEFFDVGREAEALARLDEIVGSSGGSEGYQGRFERPHGSVFQNAATRAEERVVAAVRARDFEGFAALLAPDFTHADCRRHVQLELGRDEWLVGMRGFVEMTSPRLTHEALATRGERLALTHTVWRGAEGDVGASEVEILSVAELDERGRYRAVVYFDPDDLDAAYAELDRRYEAGEGARYPESLALIIAFREAFEARDLDRIVALCAPTFVRHDRRRVAVLEAAGPAAWVQNLSALFDLAPDIDVRYDHLECRDRGYLFQSGWHGTREGGDFEIPFLGVIETDGTGKLARIDVYEPEQVDEARARFAELAGSTSSGGSPPTRFANAASRASDRTEKYWRARDWDGLASMLPAGFRLYDRRRLSQVEIAREDLIAYTRPLGDMPSTRAATEIVATRGDRLALIRWRLEVAGGDVGPSEVCHLNLYETDERGELKAMIRWEANDLDAAFAELEERYTAGERGPAGRIFREFLDGFAHRDWEALAALCARDFVQHDRRPVGMLGTISDREAWVELFRVQLDLAPDTVLRLQHVREGARGILSQFVWQGSREGGAYELPMCVVTELGAHDRIQRVDIYEPEQLDQALARFAEIGGSVTIERQPFVPSSPGGPFDVAQDRPGRLSAKQGDPFVNSATRAVERGMAAIAARDWAGFSTLFTPDFRNFDRRAMFQLETDREPWLVGFRQIIEMTSSPPEWQVLATRGDRLVLVHMLWRGAEGDVGPSEIDWLLIIEVNDRGEHTAVVTFDPDDLDAAYAELDARWEAGEAAAYPRMSAWMKQYRRAFGNRDWEALAALLSTAFVGHDYRLVGWGTLRGPMALLPPLRAMVELAPDARTRILHVCSTPRGCIGEATWVGTHDGGEFESPYIVVMELDDAGLAKRFDFYDPHHIDQALARYEEVAGSAREIDGSRRPADTRAHFENAASRKWDAVVDAWRGRDMERFTQLQPRPLRYRDHRKLFQLDLDREEFFEFARPLLEMREGRTSIELLATRGDRLALTRVRMEVADDAVGPSEIDSLLLIETDQEGEITAYDRYDEEDLDAAYAEVDARWAAGEGAHPVAATARANLNAFARRDWDAYGKTVASDFHARDHRLLVWGETLRDADTLVRAQQALVELAPDVRYRTDHVRISDRADLLVAAQVGNREGGAFETPFICVAIHNDAGQLLDMDVYGENQLAEARARFAEVAGTVPASDPLAAINTVSPALLGFVDFLETCIDSGDWDGLRRACAPGFEWEDRRRQYLLSGGLDMMIASVRERAATGARIQSPELLGSAGDRIAIGRTLWLGGPPEGRFEFEYLFVSELDEEGRFKAVVLFDLDDPRAAQREAWARWAAIEPVAKPWVELMSRCDDAYNDRDLIALRTTWAEDIVVHDHRRTGFGRLEGTDAYTEALSVLWDLAPDTRSEIGWYWLACDRHAALITNRRTGTIAEGGAYESEHLMLFVVAGDRITGIEYFEIDALDEALARFEELRVAGGE